MFPVCHFSLFSNGEKVTSDRYYDKAQYKETSCTWYESHYTGGCRVTWCGGAQKSDSKSNISWKETRSGSVSEGRP